MGQFEPIASANLQTEGKAELEDWASQNIDDKVAELLAYDRLNEWYESFGSVLSRCFGEADQAFSTVDACFNEPNFAGIAVATLDDAKDAVMRAMAPLEDLKALSDRTMDYLDDSVSRIISATEDVSELYLRLASAQDTEDSDFEGSDEVADLMRAFEMLAGLPESVKKMEELSNGAVSAAYYADDMLESIPGASGSLESFPSLVPTVAEFPIPNLDVCEQELKAIIAAAQASLSERSASSVEA